MKITLKYFTLLLVLFGWLNSNAQDPLSLYYLENIPQSNLVNPAMAPRCNGFIGIPGVNSIYINFNTDLPANVLFQQTETGTSSLLSANYDYDLLYKKIGDGANIRTYELLSPIMFGFKLNEGYFIFSMSEKVKLNMFLAKGFFNMTDMGIPSGSDFDFSNTGFDAQLYSEYAVGYSRNISPKFRVGGRLKLLQGLVSIKSDVEKAKLHTEAKVWTLDMKGTIYSSGTLEIEENENGTIGKVSLNDEFSDFDAQKIFSKYGTSFKNMGLAIDLGATYDLNYSWSFSASLTDLGFIKWKNDLSSIHFNGEYDFVGLEVDNSNIDSINKAVDNLIDTIKTVVNYHSGSSKFTTGLGTQFHLGAEYHVNHVFSAGFLSRTMFDRNYFHQEFNLSANLNMYNFLTANINYNVSMKGENYLGFGLGLRGGPIQFYLLLDHIPLSYTNYVVDGGDKIPAPYEIRAFNVMLGLNIILGSHGYKDEPKIDAYSEF